MKIIQILLSEFFQATPEYITQIEKIKNQDGKFLGKGDYGSVYMLNGKAIKITTDSEEIENAKILQGRKTKYFTHIYNVDQLGDNLAVITRELLYPKEPNYTITNELVKNLKNEATQLGIDPENLDIKVDNFMLDKKTNTLKLIDV
jgi:hypothetical protein